MPEIRAFLAIDIDDELKQSTIVDSNGIADFYLDADDVEKGVQQTLKVMYYQRWNTPLVEPAIITINNNCTGKAGIPIVIQLTKLSCIG